MVRARYGDWLPNHLSGSYLGIWGSMVACILRVQEGQAHPAIVAAGSEWKYGCVKPRFAVRVGHEDEVSTLMRVATTPDPQSLTADSAGRVIDQHTPQQIQSSLIE